MKAKTAIGCKIIQAVLYVRVSRMALLFFVGYAVKTRPGQKGISLHCGFTVGDFIYFFVCGVNFTAKTLRQRRNLFVAPEKEAICPRGATCLAPGLIIKFE